MFKCSHLILSALGVQNDYMTMVIQRPTGGILDLGEKISSLLTSPPDEGYISL